jgi:glycerol kinase
VNAGVLALDQGSHASRACIFDDGGVLLASASVPVATRHGAPLHVEQDADELASSLRQAATLALRQALRGVPDLELRAAGLAVQRSTIVCCSRRDGVALTPALSWQDRRNAAWLERLAPRAARVRAITGLPLSPHYGASKMRWCLEHVPAVARAAQADELLAAPLASFLALRLGGAPARDARVDAANAGRTQLFDSLRLDWSDELLADFALERDWLPRCAPTQDDWGTLRLDGAEVPLRAITGDQSAVPYADGAADPGTVYVNLGTGAFIQRPLAARPQDPAPLLGSVLWSDAHAATYSLEGTVNGAGSAVSWFCEREHCTEAPLWAALDALGDRVALPLFINGIGGLGSPWWRTTLEARFIEAPPRVGAAPADAVVARFAALVESVAFMIATNAKLLAAQAGAPRRVLLAGGMSRSGWLCRRVATLLEVPVQVIDAEASARGVARLAAPDRAARWPAAAGSTWLPAQDPALRQRYARFASELESAIAASPSNDANSRSAK